MACDLLRLALFITPQVVWTLRSQRGATEIITGLCPDKKPSTPIFDNESLIFTARGG